jgi:hypothetical protein
MAKKNLTAIGGIKSISITYDDTKYKIKEFSLSPSEKQTAKVKSSDINIDRVMTNFKVTDLNDKIVNNFSPALKIRVEYSSVNWNQGLKNNKNRKYKRPRIAYLARMNNGWAAKWVEFKKREISSFTAPGQGTNGVVILSIKTLPDPLIGGC